LSLIIIGIIIIGATTLRDPWDVALQTLENLGTKGIWLLQLL